jgi:hypothetical protein
MGAKKRNFCKLSFFVAVFCMVLMSSVLSHGQTASPQRIPMIEDWSTHHVVFSNPDTFEQATKTRPFLEWYRALSDPRYRFAQDRRNADRLRRAGGADVAPKDDFEDSRNIDGRRPNPPAPPAPAKTKPQGDWNNYLGGTTNAGIDTTMYPAKYTWDVNAAPNCTSDFMVVPANQAPANQANATGTIVINSQPADGDSLTIGSTAYDWHATTTNCSASPLKCVNHVANTTTDATDLANAINGTCNNGACTADPAVTATSSGATVTLTPTAAYNGSSGNVVLTTSNTAAIHLNGGTTSPSSLTGGIDGQASIIAFNNLYSGGGAAASQTGTVSSNSVAAGQTVTIGSLTLTATAGTAATGTITINTNPTNAQDVYIDIGTTGTTNLADIYALHDKLGDCGTATNCVLMGSTTAATAANLAAAINGSCLNPCSAPSPYVTATSSGAVVTLTAITAGTAGNSIPLSANNTVGGNVTVSGTTLTGGSGTFTALEFAYSGLTTTRLAANIVAAINANSATAGVTATSTGNVITVTATTGGTGGNSISVGETLTGFAWGGSTLAGGTPPGLCGTAQPTVMWAYDASTAAANSPMLGSPILSQDGTKVAFIESATTGAILHVLRWKSGDGGTNLGATPVAPTTSTSTGSTYTTCLGGTTSCMFNLTLGTNNNTNSPPFYNYATDMLYVGDNGGRLWKVTGVFHGTPTIAAAPWNAGVLVDSGATLTGPVYDSGTGNIFVGDSNGRLSFVPDSTGILSATNISGLGAITDPPIVDPSTGRVFVFSGGNGTGAIVEEAGTSALASPTSVNIGNNSATTHVHAGMFDNNYFTSVSTGHLYVCGKQAGNAAPALYSIPFNSSGVMTTPVNGPLNLSTTTTAQECSPLSEIYNPNVGGGTDWLFLGVPANCAFGGSTTGCIMSFNITSGTFPSTVSATAAENGGTSGIIVDNVSTSVQASSAYFTTLSSPGTGACTSEPVNDSTTCLVKRTQSGLQ